MSIRDRINIGQYDLIGQTPVPADDLLGWAQRFETNDRRVGLTVILGIVYVSTVFLGLGHGMRAGGPPVLFESMAFWRGEGGYEQDRCSTWLEAETMHARMVAEVSRPRAVLAYVLRRMWDTVQKARDDWKERWREVRGAEPEPLDRDPMRAQAMESMKRMNELIGERENDDWMTYG